VREIDAGQQHQQIAARDRHHARVFVGGPREGAVLEALVEHPEARLIPDQDLHAVAASIAEHEQMARQRIEGKALADDLGQAIDGAPQVTGARRQVDPDGGRHAQHDGRRLATTALIQVGHVPAGTSRRSPLGHAITSRASPLAAAGSTCTATKRGLRSSTGAAPSRGALAGGCWRTQSQKVRGCT
jgi:hypothetical protein